MRPLTRCRTLKHYQQKMMLQPPSLVNLQACRLLFQSFVPRKHIHFHMTGRVLDRILDAVDQEAKNTAQKQHRQVGWISHLDTEQAVFTLASTQKHDLSTYIEHKLREMYCARHGVTLACSHTQYALYANTVMRAELLWSVHLHTVTQRHHIQHLPEAKCTLCKLPITNTHAQADRPLFLRTWYIYIKRGHFLPSLNASWHKSLPTPRGTLIATPIGHIVFLVNPDGCMRVSHDLRVIGVTGEVSSLSMHMATKHGATNTMMTRNLGFFLTTWYKVQHSATQSARHDITHPHQSGESA